MKERPILFTPENAQKVAEGRKTQTRRIVKGLHSVDFYPQITKPGIATFLNRELANPYDDAHDVTCHYGVPGDRLWVREAWQVDAPRDGTWADTQFYGCKGSPLSDIPAQYQRPEYCLFRASWTGTPIIWRPSIHMPRWACRTILEITEIRVQRLQEISEEDAKAEGVKVGVNCPDHIIAFGRLWESINGAGSWAENPWVWCVSFKKVQP